MMEWIVSLVLQPLFYCDHNEGVRVRVRQSYHETERYFTFADKRLSSGISISIRDLIVYEKILEFTLSSD